MAKAKAKRPRFDHEEIAMRIEAIRTQRGVTAKEVCFAADMTPDRYYRKLRHIGNTFTLDELSAIADLFDAPPAWPFVDWKVAEVMRRMVEGE